MKRGGEWNGNQNGDEGGQGWWMRDGHWGQQAGLRVG